MTVTFHIQKVEEMQWIERLLKSMPSTSFRIEVEPTLAKTTSKGLVQELHGAIQLPNDFDYKEILGNALSEKYEL